MDARQIRRLKPKLSRYYREFDDCFARKDTRAHLPTYVEGQLSDLPRKSVEPIALKAGVPVLRRTPRRCPLLSGPYR